MDYQRKFFSQSSGEFELYFRKVRINNHNKKCITPPNLKLISLAYYNKKIFLFGGQTKESPSSEVRCTNELFIFDLAQNIWYKGKQTGSIPPVRCAYSLNVCGRYFFLFGGRDTKNHQKYNDLYEFDMSLQNWRLIKTSGNFPSQRDTPLSFLIPSVPSDPTSHVLYVYGGHESYNYVSDLYRISLSERIWRRVKYKKDKPPLLLGQTLLFTTQKDFYFYGGLYDQEKNLNVFSNEVFKVDLQNNMFTMEDYKVTKPSSEISDKIKEKRRQPSFGHISFQISDKKAIVIGGSVHSYFQNDYKYVDDVYMFCKEKGRMISQKIGCFPSRCFSSLIKIDRNKWMLFGGRTKEEMEGTNTLLEIEYVPKIFNPFLNLLRDELFCDTLLILKDNLKISCHSLFLFNSNHLYKILHKSGNITVCDNLNDIKLNNNKITLKINEKKNIFILLLEWLYGSHPNIQKDNFIDFYDLAKRYKIPQLMKYICDHFEEFLSHGGDVDEDMIIGIKKSNSPLIICYENFMKNKKEDTALHNDFKDVKEILIYDAKEMCLKGILKNKKLNPNFLLIANDGEKFYVHKEVLITYSEYFRRMLCGNFRERSFNSIKENTTSKVMNHWLNFFYSKKVINVSVENLVRLYLLSDEKCMFKLRDKCTKKILNGITKDNVLQTILLTKPMLENSKFFEEFERKIKVLAGGNVIKMILNEAKSMLITKAYSFESTK